MFIRPSRAAPIALVALLLLPLVPAMPTVLDNDAGTGTDAGDSPTTATRIAPGSYYGRIVASIDTSDWYVFSVEAGQGILVTVAGTPVAPSLLLNGPGDYSNWVFNGLSAYAPVAGNWTVGFFSSLGAGAVIHYEFTLQLVDLPAQDDGGSGRDAWAQGPVPLSRDEATHGHLNAYDRRDTFTFHAVADELFTVTTTWNDRPGGPSRSASAPWPNYPQYVSGDATSTTYRARHTGEHLLHIVTYDNGGNYTIVFGAPASTDPNTRPSNDNRDSATVVSSFPSVHLQSTKNATNEAGEYRPCGASATVWYRFTAPANGTLTLSTAGSNFDTTLALFNEDGSFIACNDDYASAQSRLANVVVSAGKTYFVQAGGYGGATGSLSLSLSEVTPIASVDLVVEIEEIRRGPIQTDVTDAPNLVNERRVVVMRVTNEGPDATTGTYASLYSTAGHRACTYAYGNTFVGGATIGPLAPGESRLVEFGWETTRALGDQTLTASASAAWPDIELDVTDNFACAHTFVRVGGLGGFA